MKLEIGYRHPFEVRHEKISLPLENEVSILFISDLHLGAFSADMIHTLVVTINRLQPAIILLGGDYVDWPGGYKLMSALLSAISDRTHVFAIAGNHDRFWGTKRLRKMMHQNNVTWLENESIKISIGTVTVRIDGGKPQHFEQQDTDVAVLLVHKPIDPEFCKNNYQLIFAGHLHGCQCVFWENEKGLYPGRFLYKWNRLKAAFGNCRYFISKGLGDILPVRYNCRKDVVFVTMGAS